MKKKNEPSQASRAQKPGSAASRGATAQRRAAQHPARSSAEQKRPPTARSQSTLHQRRRLLRVAAGSVVGGLVAGPVGLAAGVIVGAALPDTPAEVKGRPARKRSQQTPRRRTTRH